jgi:DNA-directed RNA polymerase specialized sigma24 family protein
LVKNRGPRASSADGHQCAEREEKLLRVAAAMAKLPQDQRDVILLRDSLDTPIRTIAEQLGRSSTVLFRLLETCVELR